MDNSSLVVCSGGLDSVTALYWAMERYKRVEVLSFRYGQNHQKMENAAVKLICDSLGIDLTLIDLSFIGRYFRSSLLGGKIPEGHYAASNMASTVVPFRNGIMLSVAAGFAESRGLESVIIANHGGDHFIYPDCRPEFICAMEKSISTGTNVGVRLISPFCSMSKAEIVSIGANLGVPFEKTYSCYKGGVKHCGKCGTCVERKEAFKVAGVSDPTEYEN